MRGKVKTKGVFIPAIGLSLSRLLTILAGFSLLAILPFVTSSYIATDIIVYAILATAFNLVLGYTGLFSWGQAIFFGVGAYSAGLMLVHWRVNIFVALLGGAVAGAIAAFVVGWFSTRTRGLYFILLTMALNQVVYLGALTWRPVTGGADGLRGVPRMNLGIGDISLSLQEPLRFYWFSVFILLICIYLFKRIIDSPLGIVFRAIKENEDRILAVGFNTYWYKILSVIISGAMSGLAGCLYALHWGLVPISSIELMQSSNIVFMSILGGVGHPLGPAFGAAIFIWLRDMISSYWARWPIILGCLIIIIVFFLRGGLMEGWLLIKSNLKVVKKTSAS